MSVANLMRNPKLDNIILTTQERNKHQTIQELTRWLEGYDWDYFLTLTFKHSVYDSVRVSTAIENFINSLSRQAFGARSSKRIQVFPVIEKGNDNSLHVHMLIQDPKEKINPLRQQRFNLRNAIIEAWMQASSTSGNPALASSGDEWMVKVDGVPGIIGYMSKQLNVTLGTYHSPIAAEHICLDGRKHCA